MTGSVARGEVESTDRVSDVLARDEALVEVFVRHAPHFAKLRNRAMRRVMARLVTVADAARMAGVEVDALVAELNVALGATRASAATTRGAGEPAGSAAATPARSARSASSTSAAREDGNSTSVGTSRPVAATVVELDVRDELRAGLEPFSRIMAAVGALHDDEVLLLRAIFEPVPLFAVLWKRGFAHESVERAREDWWIWFWRLGRSVAAESSELARESTAAAPSGSTTVTMSAASPPTVVLDVRGLEPPEPLRQTLAALEALPDGHELLHVNVRVPQMLLPMLAERGFACALDETHADRVLLRIWRPA